MDKREFLNNIKEKIKSARLPEAEDATPASPQMPTFDPAELVDQFQQELEAVSGQFHMVQSADEALRVIGEIFEEHEAQRYIGWDDQVLPINGVHDYLHNQRYIRLATKLPHAVEDRTKAQAALAEASIGITGAQGGLADTGSIVVTTGAGQGRMASLLPMVHIALLTVDQLHPTMAHFVQANPDIHQTVSNVTIITGPSRTADIEQTLTLGVHGPGLLHVICFASES